MDMLGREETITSLANGVRLYGYILRRDKGHALSEELHFRIE